MSEALINVAITVIIILLVLVAFIGTILILMQTEREGGSLFGGGSQQFILNVSKLDFPQKLTAILLLIFILGSIAVAYLIKVQHKIGAESAEYAIEETIEKFQLPTKTTPTASTTKNLKKSDKTSNTKVEH